MSKLARYDFSGLHPVAWVVVMGAVALAAQACGGSGDGDMPPPATGLISAEDGGVVETAGGEVRLSVEPGAVDEDREVTITAVELSGGGGADLFSPVFDIEPSGLEFSPPATLSIAVDRRVDAGRWVYGSRFLEDEQTWSPVDGAIPHTDLMSGDVVGGNIDRLSRFAVASDPAEDDAPEYLAAVRDDESGLWGYIDRSGDEAIAFQFEEADSFQDHMALARIDGEWVFITATGRVVFLACDFERASDPFSHGRAPVRKSLDQWAFINRRGEIVTPTYRSVEPFREGLAAVQDRGSGEWGFIDAFGEYVIEPRFSRAQSFSEGLAAASVRVDGELRYGFIDKSGDYVIEPHLHGGAVNAFREGLARVKWPDQGNEWGYVDRAGEVAIEPQFVDGQRLSPSGFREGLSRESTSGARWGFIDETGEFVIEEQYSDYLRDFSEGVAAATTGVGCDHYIDSSGATVIEGGFNYAGSFFHERAAVRGDDNRYGYLAPDGSFAVEPRFERAKAFRHTAFQGY